VRRWNALHEFARIWARSLCRWLSQWLDRDYFSGYNVWDLTAEFRFWKGRAGVFVGIRNLFDEQYWGEVREEGIMPALPRNFYGGFEFFF
jgi:outer membrane receptor protein involved in Fe transport